MKTLYWPWLHVLAIHVAEDLLLSVFLLVDPSRRSAEAHEHVHTHAHLLIWASLFVGLFFSAYGRPYRWFWLAWLSLVFVPMLATFASYVLPSGQVAFWIAAQLAPVVPKGIDGSRRQRYLCLSDPGIAIHTRLDYRARTRAYDDKTTPAGGTGIGQQGAPTARVSGFHWPVYNHRFSRPCAVRD